VRRRLSKALSVDEGGKKAALIERGISKDEEANVKSGKEDTLIEEETTITGNVGGASVK